MVAVRNTRKFTVDEYNRMGEVGILGEDDRVELIEGEIVEMPPIGNPHWTTVDRLNMLLASALGPLQRAIVSIQNPVAISDISEPQPDVVVRRHRDDFYTGQDVSIEDILLLIEVSDTTIDYDRRRKLPLYARAGVAEVWIVDINGKAIEVYREPGGGQYARSLVLRTGESTAPLLIPELTITVDDVLGTKA